MALPLNCCCCCCCCFFFSVVLRLVGLAVCIGVLPWCETLLSVLMRPWSSICCCCNGDSGVVIEEAELERLATVPASKDDSHCCLHLRFFLSPTPSPSPSPSPSFTGYGN